MWLDWLVERVGRGGEFGGEAGTTLFGCSSYSGEDDGNGSADLATLDPDSPQTSHSRRGRFDISCSEK